MIFKSLSMMFRACSMTTLGSSRQFDMYFDCSNQEIIELICFVIQYFQPTWPRFWEQWFSSPSGGNASRAMFWWRSLLILIIFWWAKSTIMYLKTRHFFVSKWLQKFWEIWKIGNSVTNKKMSGFEIHYCTLGPSKYNQNK